MSRRVVIDGSVERLVNFDDGQPVAESLWALAVGRVIDEETGLPILGALRVTTPAAGITPRVGADGAFAFAGRPWIAFPPLAAPTYVLRATVSSDGYVPVDLSIAVPIPQRHTTAPAPAPGAAVITLDSVAQLSAGQLLAIGPFAGSERARIRHLGPGPLEVTLDGGLLLPHGVGDPVVADGWTPVVIGIVPLRRNVTVIRGRAVRRTPATNTVTPVAGAVISVMDFWTTLAEVRSGAAGHMTTLNPVLRMFAVAVTPGLTTARDLPTSQLASRTLTPSAPPDDRVLAAAVRAGADSLAVSDRSGIGPPPLLRVDPDRPEVSETVTVTAVSGYGPPDSPGTVRTALPLRGAHDAGARVVPVAESLVQPPAAVRRDVQSGDRVLFVDDLTNLPDGSDGALTDAVAAPEYQRLRRLTATSDARGYFTLPPIHRIAVLSLLATAPMLASVPLTVRPDYTAPEQLIDVVFA